MEGLEGLMKEKEIIFSGTCASFSIRTSASIPESVSELVGVRELVFGVMAGCHHMVMWSQQL